MGILNLTPDSFSDGGHFLSPQSALDHALRLLDDGAHLLDLGGESTRPNATPISPEEEQSRVLPVLEAILGHRPDTILSIDTYRAATARRALEAGAEIVNDVSGLTWDTTGETGDSAMARTCAELPCGAVLMHTRGRPQNWATLPPLPPDGVLPLVRSGLEHALTLAHAAGIAPDRIVLDPGIGFGKLGAENYTLLARLAELHSLGHPILVGLSRKGFLSQTLAQTLAPLYPADAPLPMTARDAATHAANVACILAGAHILRVHDVRTARTTAAIADAILTAT
jgi:dihydropteroate synthase